MNLNVSFFFSFSLSLFLVLKRKTRRSKLPDHSNQDPKRDSALWQNSLSGRNKGRWSTRLERTGGTAASALRRGNSRRGGRSRLKSTQEPHDPSSSKNFTETRGAAEGARLPVAAAIPGEPGSVDGAHQAPSSDFVPKCDITGKDALSALHRAASQQCRQEIANIMCQHQAGQLMPNSLPQFCPQLGKKALNVSTCFWSSNTECTGSQQICVFP